ncbi:hypothetical protein B0H11DRAFT_2126417 [Mycena galericulata]|nr:hypothetical protein B0H11DRAFT_2126417 [Mycena galericulata]
MLSPLFGASRSRLSLSTFSPLGGRAMFFSRLSRESTAISYPSDSATTSSTHETYINYRVYTEDEAIPSKTAFDPADPFQGRIRGRSIPPPHTIETLKRCLAHAEGFSDPLGQRLKLYRKPSATYPMPAEDIFGIGITTWDDSSLALKIFDLTAEETAAVEEINVPQSQELDPPYLYYHLYTQTGEATSKVAFDPREPAIGRIERFRDWRF